MDVSNQAARQGWVKAVDPGSGRTYFANTVTRKTQWDPPAGWVDDPAPSIDSFEEQEADDEPLPSNWEVMHDPTTGKPFYVDHERKITQWTRPKVEKKETVSFSYSPAATTHTASAIPYAMETSRNDTRSYMQEASYFQHNMSSGDVGEVDLSDSLPRLDFSVKKVADKYRLECAHCDALFTLSKRRHHCRLCGDVFCDACSNHRVLIPLEGPEFEKPVRVCDFCNKDVQQGNFFSMRRYLAPLTLFEGEDDEDNGVATARNVNAALDSLTSDLDQIVQNAEGFDNRVTIPSNILVPSIMKHLSYEETSDRAVRALASLMSLGSMAGKDEFGRVIYSSGKQEVLDKILRVLERSGTDRRTLFVQEKAAQLFFYLTESELMTALVRSGNDLDAGYGDDGKARGAPLDIQRCLRNMLDHSSSTKNPNLQRWSTATIRNLVVEDQRRTCLAINELASMIASGEPPRSLKYESCLGELVASGGIMILCSLIGASDSDTRAHATSALGATLAATRTIDEAMATLADMSGGSAGSHAKNDAEIMRAIIAGGGVGSSVAQLLLSADNAVAGMGCNFIASLVLPLLEDAAGCATLPAQYQWGSDSGVYGSCREAALEIVTGGCLPALMSLVRESGYHNRPLELRSVAMETFAAVVLAVGEMGKAWSGGMYEEGMKNMMAPSTLTGAISVLNEESVTTLALDVLRSSSVQSLGSQRDTPSARIRESAGIVLGAMTSCSAEAIMELQSRQALAHLISTANDPTMTAPSSVRGDKAPRCLGILEAAASVLTFMWRHPSGATSELLDRLIEALDAGAITYLFRVLTIQIDWDSKDKSSGSMKARTAASRLVSCIFGIAEADETGIGMQRLVDACNSDQSSRRSSRGAQNIMEAALGTLQSSLTNAHKGLVGGMSREAHFQAALMDLVETSVLATGSMCGSGTAPGGSDGTLVTQENLRTKDDEFSQRRRDICKVACDIVIRSSRGSAALLPTMLVGAFGEPVANASIRLSLAIAQYGSKEQHSKLAHSGVLNPTADLLKSALSAGDLFKFSAALALVRLCGPHAAAGARGGGVQPVRDAIRVATNVLALPLNPDADARQARLQELLKAECIATIESLSKNSALWSAISKDSLASIVGYLETSFMARDEVTRGATQSAALKAILQIIQVPSHAAYALEVGLLEPLCRILENADFAPSANGTSSESMALQIIHSLLSKDEKNKHRNQLGSYLVKAVCALLASSAKIQSEMEDNAIGEIVFQGVEVLHLAIADVEALVETPFVLQSREAAEFIDAVASEREFVKALCATFIKIASKMKKKEASPEAAASSIYGPSLVMLDKPCAGAPSTEQAVVRLLFTIAVYASAIESAKAGLFWDFALVREPRVSRDDGEAKRASLQFVALFAHLVTGHHPALVPPNRSVAEEHESLRHPLVLHRLLEELRDIMQVLSAKGTDDEDQDSNDFLLSTLVEFDLAHILLSAAKDPALLDVSYDLIKVIVEADLDQVQSLFLGSKEATMSLLGLLTSDISTGTSVVAKDNRRFLARMLVQLAESGALQSAVENMDARSEVMGALASACLIDWEDADYDENDSTSHSLSSSLMQCLVDLGSNHTEDGISEMKLDARDATAIAEKLGQKICRTVLSRFLERARLQECNMEDGMDVLDVPEVAVLCAIANHGEALRKLRSVGGYDALARVAGEGKLSAITALLNANEQDMDVMLEADTHSAALSLFDPDAEFKHSIDGTTLEAIEAGAFNLLNLMCRRSARAPAKVSSAMGFDKCLDRAIELVLGDSPSQDLEGDAKTGTEEQNKSTSDSAEQPEKVEVTNLDLIDSAHSFLASAIRMKAARAVVLESHDFVRTLTESVDEKQRYKKQVAAVDIVAQLIPYVTTETVLNLEGAAEILCNVLELSEPLKGERTENIHIKAGNGLLLTFDKLEESRQEKVLERASASFDKILKSRSLSQCTQQESERVNAAELGFIFSSIMLNAAGSSKLRETLYEKVVSSLANAIQWHFDPGTVLNKDETTFWKAATTNVLQILARLMSTGVADGSIRVVALKKGNWMVAAFKKSPKRAIGFVEALRRATRQDQAASALAATKILKFMEDQ